MKLNKPANWNFTKMEVTLPIDKKMKRIAEDALLNKKTLIWELKITVKNNDKIKKVLSKL